MEQTDSLAGLTVDSRYSVLERVGRGGMGTVYHARDQRLDRDVALKFLHAHLADQPDFAERFTKEARTAAKISSPNVVSVHDQGMWRGQPYLVLEYVPGPDLRSELTRLGSFDLGTALELTKQIFTGLSGAHKLGLIHRDIKPENVLLTEALPELSVFSRPDIHAKVADFGLARIISAASKSSVVMGTVSYMAPEVASQGHADASTDVYAVGIMLYEFLTGSVPFSGETPIATAYKHINSPMPRVVEQASWLPPAVDSFISLLTSKDPAARPANADAALAALAQILSTIPEEDLLRRVPVIPRAAAKTEPVNANATARLESALTAPDFEAAQSTTVVTLPPTDDEPEEKPRSGRKKILALSLVGVLIASLAAWFFLAGPGKRIAIPEVAGQDYAVAAQILRDAGFESDKAEAFSDDVAKGLVVSTDPPEGSRINPSQVVTITVSLGVEQVQVPDLVNMAEEDARGATTTARLTWASSEEFSETVDKGHVVSQDLEAQSMVDHNSTITVIISKGREPITVPTVTGQDQVAATAALEAAGLKAEVTESNSDTVAKGTVMSQEPSEGTLFRGDTVKLNVSAGPELVDVPSVKGKTRDSAIETLEKAGFKVETKNALNVTLGLVYSQSETGKAPKGSTITIWIV